ncbi:MAG: CRISPR-associated endoribonuclease Cas6 [Ignavibacteria bacterium]|nr:CRISPR-associated endoribonuclease Cas6 [Ignavibacteria bacterium]
MRLYFNLSSNTEIVPYNYQDKLISVFHNWIGKNNVHDEISLYSLSWLQGGTKAKNGFVFSNGAQWFISLWDEKLAKLLLKNAIDSPNLFAGMILNEIVIQETPNFSNREKFIASSPIFIRKYDSHRKAIHLTFKDEDADFYLTETLKKKLKVAGLNYEIKISFDHNFPNPKTKLVSINGIKCRANFCPVILEGDPEAIKFAWNVGIGHLTGCGFGAIQ